MADEQTIEDVQVNQLDDVDVNISAEEVDAMKSEEVGEGHDDALAADLTTEEKVAEASIEVEEVSTINDEHEEVPVNEDAPQNEIEEVANVEEAAVDEANEIEQDAEFVKKEISVEMLSPGQANDDDNFVDAEKHEEQILEDQTEEDQVPDITGTDNADTMAASMDGIDEIPISDEEMHEAVDDGLPDAPVESGDVVDDEVLEKNEQEIEDENKEENAEVELDHEVGDDVEADEPEPTEALPETVTEEIDEQPAEKEAVLIDASPIDVKYAAEPDLEVTEDTKEESLIDELTEDNTDVIELAEEEAPAAAEDVMDAEVVEVQEEPVKEDFEEEKVWSGRSLKQDDVVVGDIKLSSRKSSATEDKVSSRKTSAVEEKIPSRKISVVEEKILSRKTSAVEENILSRKTSAVEEKIPSRKTSAVEEKIPSRKTSAVEEKISSRKTSVESNKASVNDEKLSSRKTSVEEKDSSRKASIKGEKVPSRKSSVAEEKTASRKTSVEEKAVPRKTSGLEEKGRKISAHDEPAAAAPRKGSKVSSRKSSEEMRKKTSVLEEENATAEAAAKLRKIGKTSKKAKKNDEVAQEIEPIKEAEVDEPQVENEPKHALDEVFEDAVSEQQEQEAPVEQEKFDVENEIALESEEAVTVEESNEPDAEPPITMTAIIERGGEKARSPSPSPVMAKHEDVESRRSPPVNRVRAERSPSPIRRQPRTTSTTNVQSYDQDSYRKAEPPLRMSAYSSFSSYTPVEPKTYAAISPWVDNATHKYRNEYTATSTYKPPSAYTSVFDDIVSSGPFAMSLYATSRLLERSRSRSREIRNALRSKRSTSNYYRHMSNFATTPIRTRDYSTPPLSTMHRPAATSSGSFMSFMDYSAQKQYELGRSAGSLSRASSRSSIEPFYESERLSRVDSFVRGLNRRYDHEPPSSYANNYRSLSRNYLPNQYTPTKGYRVYNGTASSIEREPSMDANRYGYNASPMVRSLYESRIVHLEGSLSRERVARDRMKAKYTNLSHKLDQACRQMDLLRTNSYSLTRGGSGIYSVYGHNYPYY